MELRDLIAELTAKFPRYARELAAWAPEYARALQGADMRTSLAATLARWSKSMPPRPSDFTRKQAGPIGSDGSGSIDLPPVQTNADGSRSCTMKGFEKAKAIKHAILEDMLRHSLEELPPDVAVFIARRHDAEAWMLAQHQVIDGELRSISLHPDEIAWVKAAAARDFEPTPQALAHAKVYDNAMAKGLRWPLAEHRAATLAQQQEGV